MTHVAAPLIITGLMPFVLTGIAKAGAFNADDNRQTRNWQASLTGWRQRAHWAHQNAFEAFPLFAAAVLASHQAAPQSAVAPIAAWGFVVARVVYAACYLADLGAARSLVWMASVGCCIALFVTAL